MKNYKEKLKNQIDFKMLEYKTLKKVYKKLTSSTSDKNLNWIFLKKNIDFKTKNISLA
ncbi:hypothetical protein OLS50_07460 [Campylobacter jejuni]|nr:hypothetical protein [Campylobacter jejuni]